MSGPRPGTITPGAERGQISTKQFIWLLITIITSFSGAFVPSQLIQIAGSDAWITMLVACAADIALAGVYSYMGLRFPGESFTAIAESSLGPWLGKPVGLMFPLFFFFVDAMLLRTTSDMISTLFLPDTPTLVIAGAILFVAVYGARAGLETVARAAEVMAPFFVTAITVGVFLVSPHLRMEFVAPPLADGIMRPLSGVPMALSFLAICIIMGTFQAFHNEPHRAWFSKTVAVTTGAAMITVLSMAAIAIMGPGAAGSANYPDLVVARVISVGEFVERVELVWVVITVGAAVVSLTILLWNAASGIAGVFGAKEYRSLILPLAGLMLPLSLGMFSNQVEELTFIRRAFPLYALTVEAGLEILVWLVALARGKRGKGQSNPRVDRPERPM